MTNGAFRLVAVDLDGTVLDNQGKVTLRTKATLQSVTQQGVHVAVATGRRYIIANFLPGLLEIPLYMILSNGAVIRDHTGAIVYESYLPEAWAWRAVEEARKLDLQSVIYENAHAGDRILVDGDWRENAAIQASVRRRPELEPLYLNLSEVQSFPDPVEIVLWGQDEPLQELSRALHATGFPYTLIFWKGRESSSFVRDGRSALEILGPQTSKAAALAWLGNKLGITADQIVAFGDDVNDVDMLQYAGLGVAVGSAVPAVLEVADRYVHNDDHEGVARTLVDLYGL